jgi:hypothetical protein
LIAQKGEQSGTNETGNISTCTQSVSLEASASADGRDFSQSYKGGKEK